MFSWGLKKESAFSTTHPKQRPATALECISLVDGHLHLWLVKEEKTVYASSRKIKIKDSLGYIFIWWP